MTSIEIDGTHLANELSERFGIAWDPDLMAYEEPHIFKSTGNVAEDLTDAER